MKPTLSAALHPGLTAHISLSNAKISCYNCDQCRRTPIFTMPRKQASRFGMSSAPAPLRRFALRYIQLFLIRPFEGTAEEDPLADGLRQIAGTLRAMGGLPDDQFVKQIGSEFRMLFCAAGKMKSQPGDSPIDPAKSISDVLREPKTGISAAASALRRFVALCKRRILSRLRGSFL